MRKCVGRITDTSGSVADNGVVRTTLKRSKQQLTMLYFQTAVTRAHFALHRLVFCNWRANILPTLRYKTGRKIPRTGIYTVLHSKHRLPHEVTLLKGESFPRCSQCGSTVEFQLVKAAPQIDAAGGFRIVLYELPVLTENDEETSTAESA
jgi:hypothetical protein